MSSILQLIIPKLYLNTGTVLYYYYYYYYYYYLILQPCKCLGPLYRIIPGFYIFNELDPISPFWLLEIIHYVLHFSICSLVVVWFLFSGVKTTTHD
jgi:sensor histidine kinase YesM